jgi:hypothetical protein
MSIHRLFLSFFLISLFDIILSQEYNCSNHGNFYTIDNKSGLNLRENPDTISKKILSIPYGELVFVCSGSTGSVDVDYNHGSWRYCYYKESQGYIFDGYLKLYKYQPYILIPNNMHLIQEVNQGEEYIGVYSSDKYDDNFYLKKIKVQYKKEQSTWDLEGDSSLVNFIFEGKEPIFMFKGVPIKKLNNTIYGNYLKYKFMYPGEAIYISNGESVSSILYATGTIMLPDKNDSSSIFSSIKNYEVRVRNKYKGKINNDIIYFAPEIQYWGVQTIGRHIIWVGDLDEDGKLDFVTSDSSEKPCWTISLLLSSWADKGYYCKQVSSQGYCGD